MYRKLILTLLVFFALYSCIDIAPTREGTFKLYENDKPIGIIYRLDKYQVEEYFDGTLLFAELNWETDSTYIMKGTELNPKGIDTVTFLNKIKKIGEAKYSIVATPYNIKSSYKYKAVLVRESSKIKEKYLDTLIKLNKTWKK